jgi:hypothetical protein
MCHSYLCHTHLTNIVNKLSQHSSLSRDVRTSHVDLSTPCELPEDIPLGSRIVVGFQNLLTFLKLENDLENRRKVGTVCHLCENHSKNGYCVNPLHLYFGTLSENRMDMSEEVRSRGGKKGGVESAKILWMSTHDGFTSTAAGVSHHNFWKGWDRHDKVRV